MTTRDPEALIAEALDYHHAIASGRCLCGWYVRVSLGQSWREDHQRHQAAVIAALPGVAIVALPELKPDDDGQVWFTAAADLRVNLTGRGKPTIHNLDSGNEVAPDALRRHAAELLAAARVAEGDS